MIKRTYINRVTHKVNCIAMDSIQERASVAFGEVFKTSLQDVASIWMSHYFKYVAAYNRQESESFGSYNLDELLHNLWKI